MDQNTFIIAMTAVCASALVLIVSVGGYTLRKTVAPFLDAWRLKQSQDDRDATVRMLERRVALLEESLHGMEGKVGELSETRAFERQLGRAADRGASPEP